MEEWLDRGVQGIGYEREVGSNGTPHLQGFIIMHNKASLTTVKQLNKRLHLERMKGRIDHNITYCSKEGNFTKIGKARQTPSCRQAPVSAFGEHWPCGTLGLRRHYTEDGNHAGGFNNRHYA